jgi:hypothetical protein
MMDRPAASPKLSAMTASAQPRPLPHLPRYLAVLALVAIVSSLLLGALRDGSLLVQHVVWRSWDPDLAPSDVATGTWRPRLVGPLSPEAIGLLMLSIVSRVVAGVLLVLLLRRARRWRLAPGPLVTLIAVGVVAGVLGVHWVGVPLNTVIDPVARALFR